MVVIDAVTRLIPGVLGNYDSASYDSFSTGLLEYPHYTRPGSYRDWQVPDVLLSGNHREIESWRRKESLRRTYLRRPDLLEKIELCDEDGKTLEDIKKNCK
jgi:tRNA (guanine37-N1)-methyltransferase